MNSFQQVAKKTTFDSEIDLKKSLKVQGMQDVKEHMSRYLENANSKKPLLDKLREFSVSQIQKSDQCDLARKMRFIDTSMSIHSSSARFINGAINILNLIDNGWQGDCKCGRDIPMQRILTSHSSVCIHCQAKIEAGQNTNFRR